MKTLLLISAILIAVTVFGISKSYAQYGEGFSPVQHYPPTNDTKLQLIVMNSTEFKERTTGYNYAFAGIDYNWVSKGNNNYDFGGARVTFLVAGFENGTTKGEAFNLDSQMNVKSVFEYDADRPPAGYRSDTCYGCLLSNASQTDVDKFHIGHVADGTYNETAALQRSTQLINMQNEKMAEKQNLEVQLATKQHDYDDAIKNSNATKISSLLGDINEIKNQTSSLQEQIDKITQELNVIQEANIQFYYMDPVLLKKYQAASDGFVTKIQVQYWKGKSFDEQKNAFPLVGIGVDSKKKSVEITLWKGIENSTNVDRYISVIKELMPSDVPWHVSFGEYPTAYYSTLTMHPLQQVNSGILAKDVQCNQGFQLIFKTEDGSPACVKPDTASKLVERGWATLIAMPLGGLQSSENIMGEQKTGLLSANTCGQFRTAPGIRDSNAVPVLLMNSNSTGCARLTYDIVYKYDGVSSSTVWPRLANFTSFSGLIGNYHYTKIGDEFSLSSGKDYTNSFQVTVIPQTVDLANYPVGSNFTVTYVIKPLPNATGFYDHSMPRLACESYPLSVGYTTNQVNYSDFSYIYPLNPPCVSAPYDLTTVEISGMGYKQVTLGPNP